MLRNQSLKNSVIVTHFLIKQHMSTVKASSYFKLRRKSVILKKSEFKLLYNFPFIPFVSAFISSGRTTFFLSVAASPIVYYYCESVLPIISIIGAATGHFVLVFGVSKVFKNIVGKIYVNKEGDVKEVLISSVNELGKRIDRIHRPDELVNCEYYNKLMGQLGFIQISVEYSDVQYIVNVKNCKIHDLYMWEYLFGNTPISEIIKKKPIKEIEMKKTD